MVNDEPMRPSPPPTPHARVADSAGEDESFLIEIDDLTAVNAANPAPAISAALDAGDSIEEWIVVDDESAVDGAEPVVGVGAGEAVEPLEVGFDELIDPAELAAMAAELAPAVADLAASDPIFAAADSATSPSTEPAEPLAEGSDKKLPNWFFEDDSELPEFVTAGAARESEPVLVDAVAPAAVDAASNGDTSDAITPEPAAAPILRIDSAPSRRRWIAAAGVLLAVSGAAFGWKMWAGGDRGDAPLEIASSPAADSPAADSPTVVGADVSASRVPPAATSAAAELPLAAGSVDGSPSPSAAMPVAAAVPAAADALPEAEPIEPPLVAAPSANTVAPAVPTSEAPSAPLPIAAIVPSPAAPGDAAPALDPNSIESPFAQRQAPLFARSEGHVGPASDTIVELRNGHVFRGPIRRVRGSELTLGIGAGECTFDLDDVALLDSTAPEYRRAEEMPEASVLLVSGHHLRGRLLKQSADSVVLMVENGQFVFARADVASVSFTGRIHF